MITNDFSLIEIDECSYRGSLMGSVSTVLFGVPNKIHGAFKYINGMIYFITDSGVLEFNEFTNAVVRTVPSAFEILKISCIRETLLTKLYQVIRYLQ